MSEIERGEYGPFGTAVRESVVLRSPVSNKCGFVAWACRGPTVGMSAISEPKENVWFQFGDTKGEALEKLHTELKGLLS